MNSKKKTAAIILIIIAIAAIVAVAVILVVSALSAKNRQEGSETSATDTTSKAIISTLESETASADKVLNIVYLGIDKEENRSDVMMVLSINKDKNSVNVISVLRDSKVMIEGCSVGTKIGYAYKWGGETLALKTINSSFGTNLRKYISMQFEDVAAIIDSVGGVSIDVTAEEAPMVNSHAKGMGYEGADIEAGVNNLTGVQAVAYSRIRSTEGGEYIRASRQQTVIKELFRKVRELSTQQQISFINTLSDNMRSNMFLDELTDLTEMNMQALELNEYTIPDINYEYDLWSGWEDTPKTEPSDPPLDDRQWLWIYDLDKAGERLRGYIGE